MLDEAVRLCRRRQRTGPVVAKAAGHFLRQHGLTALDPALLAQQALMFQIARGYPMARAFFDQALKERIRVLGPDHPHVATSLQHLASCCHVETDYATAEELYIRALGIRVQAYGQNHEETADSLVSLAELFHDQENYEEAESFYLRACEVYEAISESPAAPLSMLAQLYRVQGRVDDCAAIHRRVIDLLRDAIGLDRLNAITPLKELADFHAARDEFAEAESLSERALSIVADIPEMGDSALVGPLLHLAEIKSGYRKYDEAIALCERALTIQERGGVADKALIVSLRSLAEINYAADRFSDAQRVCERALMLWRQSTGVGDDESSRLLHTACRIHRSLGLHSKAEKFGRQALQIREQQLGADHPAVASLMTTVAMICRQQGNFGQAETLYRRAVEIYEQHNHERLASALNGLSIAYGAQDKTKDALETALRALQVRVQAVGPMHHELVNPLQTLGTLCYQADLRDTAEEHLRLALRICEASSKVERNVHAVVLNNLAVLEADRGNFVEAQALEERALQMRETLFGPGHPETVDALANLASFAWAASDLSTALAYLARIAPLRAEHASVNLETLPEPRMRQLLAMRHGESMAVVSMHADWAADNPDALKLALGATLHAKGRILAELKRAPRTCTIESVKAALPADAVYVEFVAYRHFAPADRDEPWRERRYCAYLLARNREQQFVPLGGAQAIDDAINHFGAVRAADRVQVNDALRKLDALLFAPVRQAAGHCGHYILCADEALHLVPFAALVDERGRYAVEEHTITHVTSARDLLQNAPSDRPRSKALVIAAPDYKGRHAPLPGALAEAKAVKRLFRTDVHLGRKATKYPLIAAKGPAFIHIATHGFFRDNTTFAGTTTARSERDIVVPKTRVPPRPEIEDALNDAGLVFAGDTEHESILTAREIAELDLHGTRLVVLSACDTGTGDIARSEGIYGLRRALSLAGVQTQIVSLWKVDDEATSELMQRLYEELRRGVGRSAALRNAQLSLLHNPRFAGPFHWAAFIAIGNEDPLDPGR